MTNQEIAKILREMAELYEMEDVLFKPRAYEKAASGVEALDKEIKEIFDPHRIFNPNKKVDAKPEMLTTAVKHSTK